MTYHTPLKYSNDYIQALKNARLISTNIENSLKKLSKEIPSSISSDIEVFPYSFIYVFYEQYLNIWNETIMDIGLALVAIFLVTIIFFSLNLKVSLIIVLTILSITINLLGVMYFWSISLNAISLVNLVMVSKNFKNFLNNLFAPF